MMAYLEQQLKEDFPVMNGVLPLHACDCSEVLSGRWLSFPAPFRYQHVFANMLDRLPESCRHPGLLHGVNICEHLVFLNP